MNAKETFKWGESLPRLHGGGRALRALEASDAPALLEIFGDPQVARYWSSAPLESLESAKELLKQIHIGFSDRRLFQWGILDEAGSTVIGTCTLFRFEPVHRRCELGFALARDRWGRGEAFDAVSTVVDFAFDVLDLHRMEADVDPRHTRCLRLLERLGFKREGVLRERYQMNGELQDAVILGLLRPDWPPGATPPTTQLG